jgi:hypothetical protein
VDLWSLSNAVLLIFGDENDFFFCSSQEAANLLAVVVSFYA